MSAAGVWPEPGTPSVWMAPGAPLGEVVRHAWAHSPAQRARLEAAFLDPALVVGPLDLQALPVMRKELLGPMQAAARPFGGLLGESVADLARIFVSAGGIFDPQGARPDYWRFRPALAAAGFGPGDVVINCTSYHLSPLGFIFDDALRSQGCVVIPGGIGQQELQMQVMTAIGVNGYVGLPSYLLALLERGPLPQLAKALVAAEPLSPSLRSKISGYGVDVYQAYGTADLGLLGYECSVKQGMHLDTGVVVEVCDPGGRPVPMGEVGEVVVTLLDQTYPLLRFGTGDLSAFALEPCPCGRSAPRIRGWMGRANDVVKVRGLFLYPRQVDEALAGFQGQIGRWQAVVTHDEHHRDDLTIRVEVLGPVDGAAVGAAVKALTRLTARVELVSPGDIAEGSKRLDDRRTWE